MGVGGGRCVSLGEGIHSTYLALARPLMVREQHSVKSMELEGDGELSNFLICFYY